MALEWNGWAALGMGAGLLVTVAGATDARACGGCFHADPVVTAQPENSVVTGHRMAVAISTEQTVLWDSVSYDGDPSDFAWVLPVGPGARIELAADAFFESLEAVTSVTIAAPRLTCPSAGFTDGSGGGGGCGTTGGEGFASGADNLGGSSGFGTGDPSITVLSQQTVGPYDVVTLRSREPGALVTWLTGHSYVIPEPIHPVIEAYEGEGADFLALRLQPNQGVRSMKPVRVVYPGPLMTFPLRMVQAGTGQSTAVVLYILGEGRWGISNMQMNVVNPAEIVFDFTAQRSNYQALRTAALQRNAGLSWVTTYARRGAVFSPTFNPLSGANDIYVAASASAGTSTTLADLYVAQGVANGETAGRCASATAAMATESRVVVDPCDATGTCRAVNDDEVDMRTLACGPLDDLARGLVGMHPRSVWLTRVEAELPRSALEGDLLIGAAEDQMPVEHNIQSRQALNPPCPVAVAHSAPRDAPVVPVMMGALAMGLGALRRRRAR